MQKFYICTNQISFILKHLHFDYFYLVIRSKPLGQQTLPLVYLKRRQKPANYTWEAVVQIRKRKLHEPSNQTYCAKQKRRGTT